MFQLIWTREREKERFHDSVYHLSLNESASVDSKRAEAMFELRFFKLYLVRFECKVCSYKKKYCTG